MQHMHSPRPARPMVQSFNGVATFTRQRSTIRNWALLTCRDCAEEHQVLAEEIDAHRRDARSQRPADSFSRPEACTQDIADFSLIVDEQVCLEDELGNGERALRQVSEDLTTDSSTVRWDLTTTTGLENPNRVVSINSI